MSRKFHPIFLTVNRLYPLCCWGAIFIINWTMTTLAGIIDAAVLFLIATGVTLSLIVIVSSVMFKEKLKLLSILSIVVMIGGVILLNL